jgi:hypothetical protein
MTKTLLKKSSRGCIKSREASAKVLISTPTDTVQVNRENAEKQTITTIVKMKNVYQDGSYQQSPSTRTTKLFLHLSQIHLGPPTHKFSQEKNYCTNDQFN